MVTVRKKVVILLDYNSTYETEKNAERYGMKVNPKATHVLKVLEKLGKNEQTYGKPYCPCLPNHNDNTVCPFKPMREHKACRCGLYVPADNS